jgi:hypothetical protein
MLVQHRWRRRTKGRLYLVDRPEGQSSRALVLPEEPPAELPRTGWDPVRGSVTLR